MDIIDFTIKELKRYEHGEMATKVLLNKIAEHYYNKGWLANQDHHVKFYRKQKSAQAKSQKKFIDNIKDYSNMVEKEKQRRTRKNKS
jgi:hypothetical protein